MIVGGRDNRIGTNTVISLVVGGGENRIANNVDGGLMVGGFRNDIRGSQNPDRRVIAPVLLGGSDNEIGHASSWAVILGGDNNRIGTNCASSVILGTLFDLWLGRFRRRWDLHRRRIWLGLRVACHLRRSERRCSTQR
ncbi:MAG: hypothetical protein AB9869_06120 [Verrucomicrobiia bacterium]